MRIEKNLYRPRERERERFFCCLRRSNMIYETKNITLHIIHVKVSSDCPCPRTVPMNVAINGAHCGCERNSWVWSKMFRTHKGI